MKPGFLNTLRIEWVGEANGRAIYSLLEDLLYRTGTGVICVPRGFQTDLASVPRLPFVYAAWGDRAHREAVLHDYLYRIDSDPIVSREEADNYFKEAMISRHQPWHIYYPMWLGVRIGGFTAHHKYPAGHCFDSTHGDK